LKDNVLAGVSLEPLGLFFYESREFVDRRHQNVADFRVEIFDAGFDESVFRGAIFVA